MSRLSDSSGGSNESSDATSYLRVLAESGFVDVEKDTGRGKAEIAAAVPAPRLAGRLQRESRAHQAKESRNHRQAEREGDFLGSWLTTG